MGGRGAGRLRCPFRRHTGREGLGDFYLACIRHTDECIVWRLADPRGVRVPGGSTALSAGDCPMANLNKVMLIGRLTRDPEVRTFGTTGGKVAAFGFAVNNKKKNAQTGQWEDEPVFLDIEAFNRQTGRQLADLVEQYFRKGAQFYLEGH